MIELSFAWIAYKYNVSNSPCICGGCQCHDGDLGVFLFPIRQFSVVVSKIVSPFGDAMSLGKKNFKKKEDQEKKRIKLTSSITSLAKAFALWTLAINSRKLGVASSSGVT